jgi:hypothetical protein
VEIPQPAEVILQKPQSGRLLETLETPEAIGATLRTP